MNKQDGGPEADLFQDTRPTAGGVPSQLAPEPAVAPVRSGGDDGNALENAGAHADDNILEGFVPI